MSAGEKRRILIARALVHRPRQLLLDEPSNALDLAAQRELRETLRRLGAEGTGLVLVTHHLGDILPEIERDDPDARRAHCRATGRALSC